MDIIHTSCNYCKRTNCYKCHYFLLNRIERHFYMKGIVDITTTNNTYHFNDKSAKMKVSQNLLIVDIIENNIETPIFFHKDQIIEVN